MSLESPDPAPPFTLPKLPKLKSQQLIVLGVVVVALIPSVFFYSQYRSAQRKLANPTQFASDEAKQLVSTVSKLMNLPSEETPTVATVNDKEKLKSQAFFAKSENGDKVLIYTTAKKAILFRPSINKIIDVAPVNLGPSASASATPAVTTTTESVVKFTILNGTSLVGLTKKYETELLLKVKNAQVVDKDNAVLKTYQKSLLIDVKGTQSEESKLIAKELSLELSSLPSGEATPSGDYVIILGTDKK